MKKLKILNVFGTRPEAVKMAPVVKQLAAYPDTIETAVCVTAQHREMLDQVLTLFNIVPDFDLDLMRHNQTLNQLAARVFTAIDPVLASWQPDWVLVQGDTTTVMAVAIAAHYREVKVGHVEAGLRTYDRANPFPEEMNRVVADHISDLHFAPTPASRDNLLREGISPDKIFITGNSVIDAILQVSSQTVPTAVLDWFVQRGLTEFISDVPTEKQLVLVTAHRRENHGKPIRRICAALRQLAKTRPELQFVYPVHRNPNIWEPVHELLQDVPGILLVPPVDYAILVHLIKCSTLILTDSGGIQEEAPTLGVPTLVLRETTERPEAVSAGVAKLVGTDTQQIVAATLSILDDLALYRQMSEAINPYGDGNAAQRIVDVLRTGECLQFV